MTTRFSWIVLASLLVSAGNAQDIATNRLSLSARLGFNMSARFTGKAPALAMPNPRTTPQGDGYNYDNGYVLTDSSGNYGGQTWYWGYDNSATYPAGQLSDGSAFPDRSILFSRSTPSGTFSSPSTTDEPSPGVELAYSRLLGESKGVKFGVELAANWQSLSMENGSTLHASAMRVTDAYPFAPGTTPPTATPSQPYQGNYGDEGFLIGDSPLSSTSSVVPDAFEISGHRRYDADLWGFRVGPQLILPLWKKLNLSVSGGLAVGVLDSTASWSETVAMGSTTVPSAGEGSDVGVLWGGFAAANLSWDFHERWSSVLGFQYQYLGTHTASFGARQVEVDLSGSCFLLIGVAYRF